MSWRGVAVVVLLALGVLAGAFLLPHSSPDSLGAAAARTAGLRSYRMTTIADGGMTSVIDVTAASTRLVIHQSSGDLTIITVGHTLYSEVRCTSGTRTIGKFTKLRAPSVKSFNSAALTLSLLEGARDVSQVATSGRGIEYSFTPSLTGTGDADLRSELLPSTAVVRHSLVRSTTLRLRIREGKRTFDQRATFVFSDFNRVPPIHRPPADQTVTRQESERLCDVSILNRE